MTSSTAFSTSGRAFDAHSASLQNAHKNAYKSPAATEPDPHNTVDLLPPSIPESLLRQAAQTIAARGAERDTAGAGQQQERSMAATVAAFNSIEGTQLTERQGWAFMQTLKLVRASATARNGRYNADDYLDGAAYAALGAECAALSNTAAQP